MFTNSLGDLDSILGQIILKTQKMVLDTSLLNIYHNKVLIKSEWNKPGKEETPSPTLWCCSYCDGKSTKIPKRDFIFARVKTGQVGT